MNNANKTAVNAVATIKKKTNTDVLRVAVTHEITQAMPQSPNWSTATDVQSSVKTWGAGADALDANAKVIANLRAQLKAAEAKQLTLRRDWTAAKKQVLTNVTVFCGGSADMVKTFYVDVITRTRLGILPAPTNLTVNPGKVPGEVVSMWDKGVAGHGFLVQHATDSHEHDDGLRVHPVDEAEVHARRHAAGREREHPRRGHRSGVAHGHEPLDYVDCRQRALTARA